MSSNSIRLVLGLVTALGATQACSSSDPPPYVPPEPLANQTGFCQALAEAVCNGTLVGECYGSVQSTLAADTQNCIESARVNFCNPDDLVYRFTTKEIVQGCINAQAAAYSDAAIQAAELEVVADACHETLSGSGRAGDACDLDSDCNGVEQLECLTKPGAVGSCQIPEEVMPGMDCQELNQTCTDGFYCSDVASACIAEQEEDDACSESEPCNEETRCVSEVCVARQGNGEMCMASDECAGGFCDIATGSTQGTCKAAQPINTTNGTCAPFLP